MSESAMVPTLHLDDGSSVLHFPASSKGYTVGRKGADLILDDRHLSAPHARVTFDGAHFWIADQSSQNGTFVNDLPVDFMRVAAGDLVRLTRSVFVASIEMSQLTAPVASPTGPRQGGPNGSTGTVPLSAPSWRSLCDAIEGPVIAAAFYVAPASTAGARQAVQDFLRIAVTSTPPGARFTLDQNAIVTALPAADLSNALVEIDALLREARELPSIASIAAGLAGGRDRSPSTTIADASFALNVALKRGGQQAVAARPPAISRGETTRRRPRTIFSWVHLSDLHFGAGNVGWSVDRGLVIDALHADLRRRPLANPQRLFITGDIAFAGRRADFDAASAWLARLGDVFSRDEVRVVPGNHDVQRDERDHLLTSVHTYARLRPHLFDDIVSQPAAFDVLTSKWGEYGRFIESLLGQRACTAPRSLDWHEDIQPDYGMIRVIGLSTVTVSDAYDGRGDGSTEFVPNMFVSQASLAERLAASPSDALVIVLTHHPPEWLSPGCRRDLARQFAERNVLHLCGHVHRMEAGSQVLFGRSPGNIRIVAGASHGEREDLERHAYSWGAIRWNVESGRWEAGWAPRTYVAELNAFRSAQTDYLLDSDGFAWTPVCPSWSVPTADWR